MKIAILTSGILPVPAVKGGAVENHIDFYLKYNNEYHLHDMTVYSVADKDTVGHPALQSNVNHYIYIDVKSFWAKVKKHLRYMIHGEKYYHYTIEYYFHEAWKKIKKQHYDIILLDNRPGYALDMKVPMDTRLIIYLHNDFLNKDTKGAQQIYEAASRILTVSNYISSQVRTINPDDKKCVAVLNGIDLQAFSPIITPYVTRRQLDFSDKDFIMVFSGRITPEKGVKELIESVRTLYDYPDIKLLIIGSSFYGDTASENDYVRSLKQLAAPVADRIRFTGFIQYKQMPHYLKIADIAVIPSLWDDPCPNTVLEAQAMGLPIISTRRGGIPEEVTEEGAILLATNDQFQENLTQSILKLYNNNEERARMSKALLANANYFNNLRYAEDVLKALSNS